jgi:hypothetical protein
MRSQTIYLALDLYKQGNKTLSIKKIFQFLQLSSNKILAKNKDKKFRVLSH